MRRGRAHTFDLPSHLALSTYKPCCTTHTQTHTPRIPHSHHHPRTRYNLYRGHAVIDGGYCEQTRGTQKKKRGDHSAVQRCASQTAHAPHTFPPDTHTKKKHKKKPRRSTRCVPSFQAASAACASAPMMSGSTQKTQHRSAPPPAPSRRRRTARRKSSRACRRAARPFSTARASSPTLCRRHRPTACRPTGACFGGGGEVGWRFFFVLWVGIGDGNVGKRR